MPVKRFFFTTFYSRKSSEIFNRNKLRKENRNQVITHLDIYRSTRLSHWQSVCSCTWALRSGFCRCVRLFRKPCPGDARWMMNNPARTHTWAAHSGFYTFFLLDKLRCRKFLKYEDEILNLNYNYKILDSIPALKLILLKGLIVGKRSKVESESSRFVFVIFTILYQCSPINLSLFLVTLMGQEPRNEFLSTSQHTQFMTLLLLVFIKLLSGSASWSIKKYSMFLKGFA